MPELPEVETIKSQLSRFLKGHTFERIEVKNQKTFDGNVKDIEGARFKDARRFAKVVCIDLSNGYSILIHVKLTGQIIYRGPNLKGEHVISKKVVGGVPGPHTLVIFHLNKKGTLYYNDIRRFGWIRVVKTKEVESEPFIKKLGPEPFHGLDVKKFSDILSKTKRNVKVVIMDQSKMGGVGNIYANDALWLSKIDPKRPANSLTESEKKDLFNAICSVLKTGLKYGGASELAFVTPDGSEGKYQDHTLVYGHQEELCLRCKKTKITKYFLGGRGTYVCNNCQK